MKTLDEVITEMEECGFVGTLADALHYLNEYKQTRQDLLDGMKRLEGKELMYIHTLANLEDNPPLTWDELKGMEGKPVWVEYEKNGNHWLIITDIKSNGAVGRGVYGENAPLYKDRIGTDWQAYRKERE